MKLKTLKVKFKCGGFYRGVKMAPEKCAELEEGLAQNLIDTNKAELVTGGKGLLKEIKRKKDKDD